MCREYRLRALQMRIRGHHSVTCIPCQRDQGERPLLLPFAYFIYRFANVETHIGCDLFIPAATCVQLQCQITDGAGEFKFNEVVNVLRLFRRRNNIGAYLALSPFAGELELANYLQTSNHSVFFARGTGFLQRQSCVHARCWHEPQPGSVSSQRKKTAAKPQTVSRAAHESGRSTS